MDGYISKDDGGEWGGAKPTCIFGFDLNVPLTSNDEDIYDCVAEPTDPMENGDDVCMVDVDDILDVEETVKEDHPKRYENTDNIQYNMASTWRTTTISCRILAIAFFMTTAWRRMASTTTMMVG
ncbi:unnamed protein product [Linum trigynum]|uniref:Uncharacterized protein n=1 Tax=Linum trigynum TaxID=586398 RepID=A0AAV2FFZ1_9ROSI